MNSKPTPLTNLDSGGPPPIVIIVSGGSCGSHLLARLIAEHVPFFTGRESTLATRPDLFDETTFKLALIRGLTRVEPILEPLPLSNGRRFFPAPPIVLTNPKDYRCEGAEGMLYLLESDNWGDMIIRIRDRLAESDLVPDDGILIEHAPAASLSTLAALRAYPGLRVIHLVRDPRDAVASMMERRRAAPMFAGLPDLENMRITTMQWLLYNACALAAQSEPGYFLLSYERLVRQPDVAIGEIMSHLGCSGADRYPDGPRLLGAIGMQEGWSHSPMKEISSSSIGRYKALLSSDLLAELSAMAFEFPELDIRGTMADLIGQFGAPDQEERITG